MITKIINPKDTKKYFKEQFIKSFNEEAKKQKIRYRLCLHFKEHVHLYGGINPFWFNSNARHMYLHIDGEFSFLNPIPEKLFKKIKSVLEKIPQKVEVEIA